MTLVETKAIFSGLVFITGGVSVLLPWAIGGRDSAERFMAWANAFAGGILGGAGLIHLLSGGASRFRALAPGLEYPTAFVLAGAGFLLILLIEAVILPDHPDSNVSLLHIGADSARQKIGSEAHSINAHPILYTLLLVLSIHSLIVGIALGAQSSVSTALIVFIAIIAHKMAAGFALGIGSRRTGSTLPATAPVAAFFASMTPLGILAGAVVQALISSRASELFEAIFDSIGAGTFVYIATVDIVSREFEQRSDRWQKWLLAASGFSMMAVLAVWI